MRKECLLYSSGLDSFIARQYLLDNGHQFDCLYFNHKGRYCKNEIEKIKSLNISNMRFCEDLNFQTIECDDAHIPNRNLLMTIYANSLGYDKVWLGGSLSDRIGDNKFEVCRDVSRLLTNVNKSYCEIDSPFYNCYKSDMISWYSCNHPALKMNLLKDTFSCFNPTPKQSYHYFMDGDRYSYITDECMKCSACFRKCAVLFSIGIFVPFISDANHSIINKYEREFRNPINPTIRSCNTIAYIKKWWEMCDGES